MDQLPDLALMQLFSFFEADELLLLRLVCKRWNHFFLQFLLPKNLIVYEHRFPSRMLWPTTNQPIKSNEVLDLIKIADDVKQRFPTSPANPLKASLNSENLLLKSVEVLNIYRSANCNMFFKGGHFLFRQLRVLHICYPLEMTVSHLDLPYLEVFKIVGKINYFELNAPNLRRFTFWQQNFQGPLTFIVSPADKIQSVETLHFSEKYLRFKSLESLTCLHITEIPDNVLEELPNLKKINLFPTEPAHQAIVDNLRQQRSALNRGDLKILVCGVENDDLLYTFRMTITQRYYEEVIFCDDPDQITELVTNYSNLVEPITWNTRIHYNLLERTLFYDGVPSDFFKKFPNIKEVVVEPGASQRILLEFLSGCRTFVLLKLTNCGFDQAFYDRLPALNSISILMITERYKNIDFRFLTKFRSLNFLSIKYRGLPIDAISETYQNNTLDEYYRYCSFFYFDFYSLTSDFKISIRSTHKDFITSFKINELVYETNNAADVFYILRNEERLAHLWI